MSFSRLKPAVSRGWLLATAGLIWTSVGLILCRLAYGWLSPVGWNLSGVLALVGIFLSVAVYRLGFLRIARKNIDRLCRFPDKPCLFAFQSWKSYLLVGFMVTLGMAFRHSAFPKRYLAIIYETIGGALLWSSLHYYAQIRSLVILRRACIFEGRNEKQETP